MLRAFLKSITYFAVFVAWVVFSNHCILSDAFAVQSTHQNHHCHDEQGSKKSSHHDSCKDNGCCQPALQSAVDSSQLAQNICFTPALNPVLRQGFEYSYHSTNSFGSVAKATGPPSRSQIHLLGLSLSPNAPPFSLANR